MYRVAIGVILGLVCAGVARADVRMDEKTLVSSRARSAGWWACLAAAPPGRASSAPSP